MLLKVLLQLLGGEVHAVTHLLVVWVVLLGGGEHLAQVIDRALDGLDLALLRSLDHQHRADRPRGCGYVEQQRLLVGRRGQDTCGGEHALEVLEGLVCLVVSFERACLLHQLVQG